MEKYLNNPFWHHGPKFLEENTESILNMFNNVKVSDQLIREEADRELKPKLKVYNQIIKSNKFALSNLIYKWNNFYKILRITSFCLKTMAIMTRGIKNLQRRSEIQHRLFLTVFDDGKEERGLKLVFTPEQLNAAKLYHIKEAQKVAFDEYLVLAKNEHIEESSKLAKLNPSMNSQGLIQMNSRLDHHTLYPEQIRTPIILPKEQAITEHIVLQIHRENSHIGPEICLREVKLQYWLTGGRREIRRCLKLCMNKNCRFPNLVPTKQIEANLPIDRARNDAFECASADYCGHFFIKRDWRKTSQTSKEIIKVWVLVIICHSTRAIHLEMVYDHTTDEFLMALKRFTNRRSTPRILQTDNAKEFIKGKSTIQTMFDKLNNTKTHQKLGEELKIKWYHSTSRSPKHNGQVESAVKIIKKPLYNSLNGKILTANEFYTLLTDVESIVNSRPLGAISESPDDNNIITITPNHLLHGKSLKPLPLEIHKGLENEKREKSLKEKWILRQKIIENFWAAWKKEYLTNLREFHNTTQKRENLKENDCVLVLTEKITKRDWPIGAINQLLRGRDGLVRSVEVRLPLKASQVDDDGTHKTQYKLIRRGVEHIIPL